MLLTLGLDCRRREREGSVVASGEPVDECWAGRGRPGQSVAAAKRHHRPGKDMCCFFFLSALLHNLKSLLWDVQTTHLSFTLSNIPQLTLFQCTIRWASTTLRRPTTSTALSARPTSSARCCRLEPTRSWPSWCTSEIRLFNARGCASRRMRRWSSSSWVSASALLFIFVISSYLLVSINFCLIVCTPFPLFMFGCRPLDIHQWIWIFIPSCFLPFSILQPTV